MDNEIKTSILFTLGLNPDPITEIDKIVCIKTKGMFIPAVEGKASLSGGRYYSAKFPILSVEAVGEKSYDELRALLHKKVDTAFDEYLKKWNERQEALKQMSEESSKEEHTEGE